MKQEFLDFLRNNLGNLDEGGLATLDSGINEIDGTIAELEKAIAEKDAKIRDLEQANIGLNKTNIDLVLKMTGTPIEEEPKSEEQIREEIEEAIPDLDSALDEFVTIEKG